MHAMYTSNNWRREWLLKDIEVKFSLHIWHACLTNQTLKNDTSNNKMIMTLLWNKVILKFVASVFHNNIFLFIEKNFTQKHIPQKKLCSQYGISQVTSHQCSRALAHFFQLSWRYQNMWATLATRATLHEVLSKFSPDLRIPASQANS